MVFGTRPQIIKISMLLAALERVGVRPLLVYTGQHYDMRLSDIFFQEFHLRQPDYNLGIGSGSYEYQIDRGVEALKSILEREKPRMVLTIGDSNPALVGCLGAHNAKIPCAHGEAGLRSGSTTEVEERNRIQIDSLSDYLFCSTQEGENNLLKENIRGKIFLTGDLLVDAWQTYKPLVVDAKPASFAQFEGQHFCLFTLHRGSTIASFTRLKQIVHMLADSWPFPTVWPIHPGVRKVLEKHGFMELLQKKKGLFLLEPASYLEMRWLEEHCSLVVTDSVGVQVEAYLAGKPCLVLRHEIEHHFLEQLGWSKRVEPNQAGLNTCSEVALQLMSRTPKDDNKTLFGDGKAADKMAHLIKRVADTSYPLRSQ
jgi:UDP-GlcNAc3NAcA epimerase